ncbi:MAG: hypothetical protein AAF580_03955 [Pseudomonadota bacterium]
MVRRIEAPDGTVFGRAVRLALRDALRAELRETRPEPKTGYDQNRPELFVLAEHGVPLPEKSLMAETDPKWLSLLTPAELAELEASRLARDEARKKCVALSGRLRSRAYNRDRTIRAGGTATSLARAHDRTEKRSEHD